MDQPQSFDALLPPDVARKAEQVGVAKAHLRTDRLGWKGIGADAVLQRCIDGAAPGAIYLFHVGQASDDAAALQRVIDALHARGYSFDSATGIS